MDNVDSVTVQARSHGFLEGSDDPHPALKGPLFFPLTVRALTDGMILMLVLYCLECLTQLVVGLYSPTVCCCS